MQRWIRFFLAIAVGLAGGLLYGWVISPVQYVDTSPDTLRIDYKSDYVLMTAEAYSADGDLALAARRLAKLGDAPPEEIVRKAVVFGENPPPELFVKKQEGYSDADLDLMRALLTALQTWTPQVEVNSP